MRDLAKYFPLLLFGIVFGETSHFHGGMGIYENDDDQTIDSVSWHMVYVAGDEPWTAGNHLNEVTFQDGAIDTVSGAFADAGGSPNEVTVTAAAHPFAVDEIVSISGSTNYNDVFEVQSATTDTFNIVSAFAAEAAAGTVTRSGNLTIAKPGLYWVMYHSSVASTNVNDSVDVKVWAGSTAGVPNALDMSESRHNSLQAGLFSTPPGCEIFAASAGDVIALGVKNTSGANDILFRYIHVMVVQL